MVITVLTEIYLIHYIYEKCLILLFYYLNNINFLLSSDS